MWNSVKILLILAIAQSAQGQDERALRELFSGDLIKPESVQKPNPTHFRVQSPMYQVDLNGDHRAESFVVEKQDGEDWLHVHDYFGKKIFSYQFQANAALSEIYRLKIMQLSPTVKLVAIHFFEGVNKYIELNANARLYFLTIENNDLETLSIYRGPAYWEEHDDGRDHYRKRIYHLTSLDLRNSGENDLLVRFKNISSAYRFLGNGKWISL